MVFSLDTRLPMAGRGYDYGATQRNALVQMQMEQARQEADQNNALAAAYRTEGAALLGSDPTAQLAAAGRLAALGPRAFQMAAPIAQSARERQEYEEYRRRGAPARAGGVEMPVAGGDMLSRIASVESGGDPNARNPASSAAGAFQITDGTWRQYAPRLGLGDADRMNPAAQRRVAEAIQADARGAVGRDLSPGEQYGAHLLGIGGLRAFLGADPNADAQTVYAQAAGPGIAAQAFQRNPGLLEPGMTVGQVMQRIGARVGGAPGGTTPASSDAPGRSPRVAVDAATLAQLQADLAHPNRLVRRDAQARLAVLNFQRQNVGSTAQPPTISLGAGAHGQAGVYERTPSGLRYLGPSPEQTPATVGTIPPGFQLERTPDGAYRMVPIPGGPADLAQQRQARADANRQTGAQRTGNIVVQDLDRTLQLLDTATLPVAGITAGTLARVPGTAAADAARLLDSVRANVGFAQLNQMRSESPTGAALGAVTERELQFLQAVLGSLDQTQSPVQFRDNLVRLRNVFLDIVHGEGGGPPRQQPGFQRGTNAPPAGARPPDATPETPGPGGRGVATPPTVTTRRYNPATGRIE
jgi:hypothetical protein